MKKCIPLLIALTTCGHQEDGIVIYRGGDQVGNGGKGVVCRHADQSIASVEILDFYEARQLYGWQPELIGDSPAEAALAAIRPLHHLDLPRYERYSRYIIEFFANARFMETSLLMTQDSEELIAPPAGCKVEQIVIQLESRLPGSRRYNVNKSIWDAMNAMNRAGIILHEIIYYEAIAQGHHNSVSARYLTGLISAGGLHGATSSYFHDTLVAAELEVLTHQTDQHQLTLIQTKHANWAKARNACDFFAAGRLGSDEEFKALNQGLETIFGSLLPAIQSPLEFWTDGFASESGQVTVAMPESESSHFQFGGRHPDYSANVLCFKKD